MSLCFRSIVNTFSLHNSRFTLLIQSRVHVAVNLLFLPCPAQECHHCHDAQVLLKALPWHSFTRYTPLIFKLIFHFLSSCNRYKIVGIPRVLRRCQNLYVDLSAFMTNDCISALHTFTSLGMYSHRSIIRHTVVHSVLP